jgi:MFS transporter, AAHS family, 3-hydroxyphenylpropionic acid transporter
MKIAASTVGMGNTVAFAIGMYVLAALCEGFDLQAAGVAAAGIVSEFKATPPQMGTFFSASTLGLFFGALVVGRLSDTLGRPRLLIISVGLYGIFSILTARAWSIESLTIARLLTGFGLGGAFPTLIAIVNEQSPAHRRRANVALVYSGMPLGGALVSLMVMLSASVHWRAIFIVGGIGPLILAAVMQRALGKSPRPRPAVSDTPEGLGDGLGSAAPKAGDFRAIFAHGRALATVLIWVSCFVSLLTIYLLLSWLPTLLVADGFTRTQAAGAQIGFNIGGVLAALLLGELLEWRSRNLSVVVTLAASPLLLFLISEAPSNFAVVVMITFALGGAILAAQGYFYAAAANLYPTPIRGVGAGATVAAGRVGSIVGPALGGLLQSAGHGSARILSDLLPLVILGSISGMALAWRIGGKRAS